MINYTLDSKLFNNEGAYIMMQALLVNLDVFNRSGGRSVYITFLLYLSQSFPEDAKAIQSFQPGRLTQEILSGSTSVGTLQELMATQDKPTRNGGKRIQRRAIPGNPFEAGNFGAKDALKPSDTCCDGEPEDYSYETLVEKIKNSDIDTASISQGIAQLAKKGLTPEQKTELGSLLALENSVAADELKDRENADIKGPELEDLTPTTDELNDELKDADDTKTPVITAQEQFKSDTEAEGLIVNSALLEATDWRHIEAAFGGYGDPEERSQAMMRFAALFAIDIGKKTATGSLAQVIFQNLSGITEQYSND